MGIKPEKEFFANKSRKLMFKTNLKNFIIIRVRAFDVATLLHLEQLKWVLWVMMF